MLEISSSVYQLLQRMEPALLLKGYHTDVVDDDGIKFCATTFVNLKEIEYYDYEYLLNSIGQGGHAVVGADEEKVRIYSEDKCCYSLKDTRDCISEGAYLYYSVKFYGYFFNNQWFVIKELNYFGERISENLAIEMITTGFSDKSIFNSDIYKPVEAFYARIFNNSKYPCGAEHIEFLGMPYLVADILQREKLVLCVTLVSYMNLEVFQKFIKRLKIYCFEDFAELIPLFSNDFTMIFPKTKEYFIVPALVGNICHEYRLYYFLWLPDRKKMYQWHYFTSKKYSFSFHYAEQIIEDLKTITYWNNSSYLNSSCTLDDETFWNEYVLKKDEKEFRYLRELPFTPDEFISQFGLKETPIE